MARQSSSENNVVMQISPVGPQLPCVPLCRKMFYSTICDQETKTSGDSDVADQGLVRETAVAIVGKLKSGEVTPLDLLDVLEKRIAEVDGKVNALPTLCFDRARKRADEEARLRARVARRPSDPDQGPDQCRRRAD